jgi:hypothetical protein
LLLLLTARRKLPAYEGTVWRGVKGVDLRGQYPKGKEVYWWAFSSTTKEVRHSLVTHKEVRCARECGGDHALLRDVSQLSTLQNPLFLGKKGVRTVFNVQVRYTRGAIFCGILRRVCVAHVLLCGVAQVSRGVDIVRYSMYQDEASEAEVLLYPGTKLRVVDSMDMGSGLYMVHLMEVLMSVELFK